MIVKCKCIHTQNYTSKILLYELFSVKSQFSYQQFSLPQTVFVTMIVLKLLDGKFQRVFICYQVAHMIFLHSYIFVPAITKIVTRNVFNLFKVSQKNNYRK